MCNKTVLGTQNQSKNYGKLVDTLFRKVEIILYTQEKLRLPCMYLHFLRLVHVCPQVQKINQ